VTALIKILVQIVLGHLVDEVWILRLA